MGSLVSGEGCGWGARLPCLAHRPDTLQVAEVPRGAAAGPANPWAPPDTACAGRRGLPWGHALPWISQAGRAKAL